MINLLQFTIGTVIGSFLTLTECRTDRNESIVFPPSHCDHCSRPLKPWEMIPIVSFLILRGKCCKCHQPIGIGTLLGETVGGIIGLTNPLSLLGILEMIFEFTLLFIAERDSRNYLIPTWALINLFNLSLIIKFANTDLNLEPILLTGTGYLVILALNHHYHWMGGGDIDLIFIIILKTGPVPCLFIILTSSLLAIIKYLLDRDRHLIPYTPYLAISYLIIKICV